MLFLIQLKNRRIFSLCSICLRCNAHDSGGIFFCLRRVKTLGTFAEVPRPVDVEGGPLRVPYIEDEIWGSSPNTHSSKKECQAK